MSGLIVENVDKFYGSVQALSDISLIVDNGQFVCLLGPSGCGKTSLLRIVAGLEDPSAGRIVLDGADITSKPAHKRDFGMVFQSLALFPHLSVGDNIAYPLAIRGVPKDKRRAEVERLLDLVHLPGKADRAITQLSGGQRQRVAIARALIMQPKLFLLDEPMSALDAKLRETMQVEVKRLQRDLGVTSLLVTHDQREAMTTADLVVVMSEGKIQQVAPPIEIYRNPANAFVADFIGITNLIPGRIEGGRFEGPGGALTLPGAKPGNATLSIRPEDIALAPQAGADTLSGTVTFVRHLGATTEISVDTGNADEKDLTVSLPGRTHCPLEVGDTAHLSVDPASVVVLG
ncbi:ABC transporter ATP-binding protein [Alloyangia pacifica]|uniref:ABC transporter ATP-binding protein n=1 Tax=Alloyangia pacifica TaxID=311180 RepID=UPI001CFD4D81|nr:ABC transporter ATP-binding protein [Alloyangia pacifica]